jgi:hypothetical protein
VWEFNPTGEYLYRVCVYGHGFRAVQFRGNKRVRSQWCASVQAAKQLVEKWATITIS